MSKCTHFLTASPTWRITTKYCNFAGFAFAHQDCKYEADENLFSTNGLFFAQVIHTKVLLFYTSNNINHFRQILLEIIHIAGFPSGIVTLDFQLLVSNKENIVHSFVGFPIHGILKEVNRFLGFW